MSEETRVATTTQEWMEKLTPGNIKRYVCPAATDQEIFMFLSLCKHRSLNPFMREAYLIKYGSGPANMVVSKDAFTQRAEKNPAYDGFSAGIILFSKENAVVYRPGSFKAPGETLVGGWAEVYRKDQSHPIRAEVSMEEYSTGKSNWSKMPATMIRKVALVQALREAFPNDFGGMYDAAEMGKAGEQELPTDPVDIETDVIDDPMIPTKPEPEKSVGETVMPLLLAEGVTPYQIMAYCKVTGIADIADEQWHQMFTAMQNGEGFGDSDAARDWVRSAVIVAEARACNTADELSAVIKKHLKEITENCHAKKIEGAIEAHEKTLNGGFAK